MKSFVTLIGILIVLAAIGGLFYGCYLGAVYLWQVYAELELVTRIVLLSSMAVVLVGSLVIAGAIKNAGFSAYKSRLIAEKLRLYKSLVDIYKPYFASPNQDLRQIYSDMAARLREIEAEMQILSAGAVIEVHGKLEAALRNRDDRKQINVLYQKLIKCIRRDLGHGSNFDESKLTFLVNSGRVENTGSTGHGVSA